MPRSSSYSSTGDYIEYKKELENKSEKSTSSDSDTSTVDNNTGSAIRAKKQLIDNRAKEQLVDKIDYFYSEGYKLGSLKDCMQLLLQKGGNYFVEKKFNEDTTQSNNSFYVNNSIIFIPEIGYHLTKDSVLMEYPEFLENDAKSSAPLILTQDQYKPFLTNSIILPNDLQKTSNGYLCTIKKPFSLIQGACQWQNYNTISLSNKMMQKDEHNIISFLFEDNANELKEFIKNEQEERSREIINLIQVESNKVESNKQYIEYVEKATESSTESSRLINSMCLQLAKLPHNRPWALPLSFNYMPNEVNDQTVFEYKRHVKPSVIFNTKIYSPSDKFLWVKRNPNHPNTIYAIIE